MLSKGDLMRHGAETARASDFIRYFRVRRANVEGDGAAFSGGNQQRC